MLTVIFKMIRAIAVYSIFAVWSIAAVVTVAVGPFWFVAQLVK